MSLQDCKQKISALLNRIDEVDRSYRIAQAALEQLDTGDVNLNGVGMNIQFGDVEVPVPLPPTEQLSEHLVASANFLAEQLTQLWNEVHTTASNAKSTCDKAMAAAKEPDNPFIPPPPTAQQQPPAQLMEQVNHLTPAPPLTSGQAVPAQTIPAQQELPPPTASVVPVRTQPTRPVVPPKQYQNPKPIVTTPVV